MKPPVLVDQELVVHLYAPLDGPHSATAYRQVKQVWAACAEQLGITEAVAGLPAGQLPESIAELAAEGVIAVRQSPAADRQAVVRRIHDVLNLSVMLAQPAPVGLVEHRGRAAIHLARQRQQKLHRYGWKDFAQMWAQIREPFPSPMLGQVRLHLARTSSGSAPVVAATAELGLSVDLLLPYGNDRASDWWLRGVTTAAGYAVWDTRLGADTNAVREMVLIAPADQDASLSAWAWSDGTANVPPLAIYQLDVARLRFEARLLDAWHRSSSPGDFDQVRAGLNYATAPDETGGDTAELLTALLSRVRAEEARFGELRVRLVRLREAVSVARRNLAAIPGCEPSSDGSGPFAADQALAQWLIEQADHDLTSLDMDIARRLAQAREKAAAELTQLQRADPESRTPGQASRSVPLPANGGTRGEDTDRRRRVFIVHGRDLVLVERFRDLLYRAKLEPLEWQQLVEATGKPTPYLGDVVAIAPHLAQATLVLLTPDDVVELHSGLRQDNDLPHERARSMQARPNVYFELGLALMAYADRTVVVEVGKMRPVGDLAGLNVTRFDGSAKSVRRVLDRLKQAGCPVDYSRSDWLDTGRFSVLAADERNPDSHKP